MSVGDGVAEKREEAVSRVVRGGKDRVRSGIPGFDELTNGDLIKNRTYLVAGSKSRPLTTNNKWVKGCVTYISVATLRGNFVEGCLQAPY